ncbi:hypothetical protein [Oceanobacillus oncorhynchi]|uniref:hypothetical protein n=1 Tax=Oceanobacillus oncorhynchi TaxID=545501 RepID=UPI001867B534|nr:hypothetical protein [Oceanobacillus oncorhynchi]
MKKVNNVGFAALLLLYIWLTFYNLVSAEEIIFYEQFKLLLTLLSFLIVPVILVGEKKRKLLLYFLVYALFVISDYKAVFLFNSIIGYIFSIVGVGLFVMGIQAVKKFLLEKEETMKIIMKTKGEYIYFPKTIELKKCIDIEEKDVRNGNALVFINRESQKFSKIEYLSSNLREVDKEKGKKTYDILAALSSEKMYIGNLKATENIIFFGTVRNKIFYVHSRITD